MGLAYTVVAASNLIGNPIAGALLSTSSGGPLTWWRAIVFTGVRRPSSPPFIPACADPDVRIAPQCVAAAGSACMAVSRELFIVGRGRSGRKV